MRLRLGGAIGLIAAGLLAACSGDEQPSTLPDAAPTSSSSPVDDAVSPTPTADPTAQLEAEITEFYEKYVESINESFESRQALQERRSMFAETCADCQRGYDLAQQAQAESLTLEGGTMSVIEVRIDTWTSDSAVFSAVTSSDAGTLKDLAGKIVRSLPSSSNVQILFQATRKSGQWVITSSRVAT
jgi:hypothetical protein